MKICHCQTQICAGGIKKKKRRKKKSEKKKVGRKHKTSCPTDGMPNDVIAFFLNNISATKERLESVSIMVILLECLYSLDYDEIEIKK